MMHGRMGDGHAEDGGGSAHRKRFRVLLVEDHPLTRLGVSRALSNDPHFEVCAQADDVQSAIEEAKRTKPDVVVLDITLKTGTGIDLILGLHRGGVETQSVVFSMHDESLYAEPALRAGARGYVNKSEGLATLIEAMNKVLNGGMYLSPQYAEKILKRVTQKGSQKKGDPVKGLSEREFEVFTRLGQGMSVRAIGEDLGLSPKTVDTYRENIKAKLGVESSHDLMRMAVRWLATHTNEDKPGISLDD